MRTIALLLIAALPGCIVPAYGPHACVERPRSYTTCPQNRPPLLDDLSGEAYGGRPRLYTEPQHPMVDETGHWRLMGDSAYRSWMFEPVLKQPLPTQSSFQ